MYMQTNVQTTSLEAYWELQTKLGELQKHIYMTIKLNGNLTNTEISKLADKPINVTVPRVFELRQLGLVEEKGKRKCRITNRNCIEWGIK